MQCNYSKVAKILYPESTPLLSHILQLLSSERTKQLLLRYLGK